MTTSLSDRLAGGFECPDKNGTPVLYRYLQNSDDLQALTELLHQAYAPLAAAGTLYQRYKNWAISHGHNVLTGPSFGKEVRKAFPSMRKSRIVIAGVRVWAYEGIDLTAAPAEELKLAA